MTALLLATLGRVMCAVGWHDWREYMDAEMCERCCRMRHDEDGQ